MCTTNRTLIFKTLFARQQSLRLHLSELEDRKTDLILQIPGLMVPQMHQTQIWDCRQLPNKANNHQWQKKLKQYSKLMDLMNWLISAEKWTSFIILNLFCGTSHKTSQDYFFFSQIQYLCYTQHSSNSKEIFQWRRIFHNPR